MLDIMRQIGWHDVLFVEMIAGRDLQGNTTVGSPWFEGTASSK